MKKTMVKMAKVMVVQVAAGALLKIVATGTVMDAWFVTLVALAAAVGLLVAAKSMKD